MFYFNISYFDPDVKETRYEHGIVAAHTYMDAMSELSEYYGEDELIEVTLFPMTDSNLIVLPHRIAPREIKEEWCI